MPAIGSTLAYPTHRASRIGLFEYSGALFTFLLDKGTGGTATDLVAMKSTDGGATWSRTLIVSGFNGMALSSWRVGDVVHLYFTNGSNAVTARAYNLATGAVTTPPVVANVCEVDFSGNRPLMAVTRSNGHVVVFRHGATVTVSGTAFRRVVIDYFNGSSWTSNVDVDGLGTTAAHADLRNLYVDGNNRVWIFYRRSNNNGAVYYKTIEPGNTALSAEGQAGSNFSNVQNYPMGQIAEYVSGSTRFIAVPYRLSSTGTRLQVTVSASAATQSWTQQVASSVAIESTTSNTGVLLAKDNLLRSFHVSDTDDDIYLAEQSTVGGAYSAESLFVAGTVQGMSGGTLPGGFGLVYNDGGAVTYQALMTEILGTGSSATLAQGSSGAGTVPITGTGSSATLPQGSTGAGIFAIPTITGTGSSATLSQGSSGTGTVPITGTGSSATLSQGSSGAGTFAIPAITGSGASATLVQGSSGAGTVPITGTGSSATLSQESSGAGTVPVNGSGTSETLPQSSNGTGATSPPVFSGTGSSETLTQGSSGLGSVAAPEITGTGSSETLPQSSSGSGSATIPTIVGSGSSETLPQGSAGFGPGALSPIAGDGTSATLGQSSSGSGVSAPIPTGDGQSETLPQGSAGTAKFIRPLFAPPSVWRTVSIPLEVRTAAVPAELRTASIPAEVRTATIEAEIRSAVNDV
jgi:hypothetical protein